MPYLLSNRTADWLRSAMSRGTGFGSRPRRIAYGGGGSGGGDGAVIGIVQRNSSSDSMSSATETEVNENQLTVTLYPNWPNTTGSRTARLYTPCVYRRAPLMVGDPILCHPCAVAVTTEGEDS